MNTGLSLILFITFLILSGFHFYWLFGGNYGVSKVIPTRSSSQLDFKIPKFATLLVALVLLSFSLFYLMQSDLIETFIPKKMETLLIWLIPLAFTLRAIGEFRFVGFFKRIKDTPFAKADTVYFSPLCLFIGLIGFMIWF